MKLRTKRNALRLIRAAQALPNDRVANVLGTQMVRAGTSVGANYCSASRTKSTADFLNKLKIVEEECDESLFWMELLVEAEVVKPARLGELMREGNEILAIVVASLKTTREGMRIVGRNRIVEGAGVNS